MKNYFQYTHFKIRGIDKGLILKEFIQAAEFFTCLNCRFLAKDPYSCTECDSIYCNNCFKFLKKCLGKIERKDCHSKMIQGDTLANRELNILNDIELKCPNHMVGCDIKALKYRELLSHINRCNFKTFQCRGCDFKENESKVQQHVQKCREIKIKCEYCNSENKIKDLKLHQETCEEIPKICPFCNRQYKEKDIFNHSKDCLKKWFVLVSNTNLQKVKEFDIKKNKLIEIENKINKQSFRIKINQKNGKENDFLSKKRNSSSEKKEVLEDIEEIADMDKKTVSSKQETKVDSEIIVKKKITFETQTALKPQQFILVNTENDVKTLKWKNNSLKFKNTSKLSYTTCSIRKLNEREKLVVRLVRLQKSIWNAKCSIGFSTKPIDQIGYTIGETNVSEWSIREDGMIIENNGFKNDEYQEYSEFKQGDIVSLQIIDKRVSFRINSNEVDYSYYYSSQPIFLIATLPTENDEIELIEEN